MLNKVKASFYTLFLIALNLIYLVIELSFNARILDASAAFSPTTDFSQLEIYGRTISASGATLFAWRLLVPAWSSISLFRITLKLFLITLIVFPVVFIGQKNLVDNLVNQSSNETRRTAEILNLLKFGVANGFVEIEELSVDELLLQTAEGKMFITLSGLLAYNSKNMRVILERELEKIAAYAITTQQSESSYQLYKSYQYVSKQIMGHYQDYQFMVDNLEREQSDSYGEAVKLYQNAMNKALLLWLDYQQQLTNSGEVEQVSSQQIADMQYLLMTGQQRLNSCVEDDCYLSGLPRFQARLARQLGVYSVVSDWCEKISENSIILKCLKDSEAIKHKIIVQRKLTLAVSAGLTRVHLSKLEFLKSADLRSAVFEYFNLQGIETNENWRFEQHELLLEDISNQLKAVSLETFNTSVYREFVTQLEPRIELSDFSQLDKMQNYFARAFGELYHQPVYMNLTLDEFEKSHVAPIYLVKFNALFNKLKADEKWYDAEAPYEQSGKSSVRNLVVPAVAIAFSLIFGLLNLINLILNLLFFMIEEKRWIRWFGFTLLTVFILMMPVRHHYQIYSQPAYLDLLAETQKNYGLWVNALDWVAKTEPLVYPIGNILRYNLMDGFSFD